MGKDFHVQGVAGLSVGGLRLVADNAQFYALARAAMGGQRVVATIAIRRAHDIARRRSSAGGHEIEYSIVIVGAQVEFRKIS